MLFRLFLLFALLPVIELALLVQVGSRIGVTPTVALVLATGAAGAFLARAQGLRALRRLQAAVGASAFPGDEIFDGVLILGGGLLLLTPGLLTDAVGFGALIPGTRRLLKRFLERQVRRRLRPGEVRGTYTVE